MNKKVIFILVFVLLAGILSLSVFINRRPGKLKLVPIKNSKTAMPAQVGRSRVGVGWSVDNSPEKAVIEALEKAKSSLGGAVPQYAYVTFTVGYDDKTVIDTLRSHLDKSTKIHGFTSSLGVITNEGLHKGEIGSIAVLLVVSEDIDFGVSMVDIDRYGSPQEAGKTAVLNAISDAGKERTSRPVVIIYSGTPRRSDDMQILDGIASVVGNEVPVIGGNAGDEKRDNKWRQFTRDNIYDNGLLLTVIYTDLKVGWAFEAGARVTDKGGIVTKAKGNEIYQINGEPAFDVYNGWLNGELTDVVKNNDFKGVLTYTSQYPLCKVVRGKGGVTGYYPMHPIPALSDLETKVLRLAVPISEGSEIKLCSGTWETILNRAEIVPEKALLSGGIREGEGIFGIIIYCYGLTLTLPDKELSRIPVVTDSVVKKMPFIGGFTLGEHGPIPGIRSINANLAESMVIIGLDSK